MTEYNEEAVSKAIAKDPSIGGAEARAIQSLLKGREPRIGKANREFHAGASAATEVLVAAVQAYALAHYNEGGWDVIYEAYEDAELAEAIGGATTLRGALAKLRGPVSVWAERQAYADSFSEETTG